MQYVMSDVGGCLRTFKRLLKKVSFSEKEDVLFIVGGINGIGKYSVKLMLDLCMRPNVYPIWGETDLLTRKFLNKLHKAGSRDAMLEELTAEEKEELKLWASKGGMRILADFEAQEEEKRIFILEYFDEFEPYAITKEGKRVFVMLSGGFNAFEEGKELSDYDPWELATGRLDMNKAYFPKTYLLTGHRGEACERVTKTKAGNINIDCGAPFGGRLACLGLDTGHVWYQDTDPGDLEE